jgi:hypothetical protein
VEFSIPSIKIGILFSIVRKSSKLLDKQNLISRIFFFARGRDARNLLRKQIIENWSFAIFELFFNCGTLGIMMIRDFIDLHNLFKEIEREDSFEMKKKCGSEKK